MGRPKKEIEKKHFENLCGLQCTEEEICAFFDVTDKTLNSWCKRTYGMNFSEVFRIKRGLGKISLRRNQWRLSEHNANMAIWLGRQYLGQTDHPAEGAASSTLHNTLALLEMLRNPAPDRKIESMEGDEDS